MTWFITNGEVTDDGGLDVTDRGFVYNTSGNPDLNDQVIPRGSGTGTFTFTFTSMAANTTYYVKSYATNTLGTSYSTEKSVTLKANLPTVITSEVTDIIQTSATVGGEVIDDGGLNVTERGIYYGTSPNPESTGTKVQIGSGTGSFSEIITDLTSNTMYYLKAYAVNAIGTGYGNEISFTTLINCGVEQVADYDGNSYNTVQIGNQCWMAENLKTTHYANGTEITLVEDATTWSSLTYNDKVMCYYDDDFTNASTYGALYTWAAASNGVSSDTNPSDVQGACPDGWHLPSDDEWKVLEMYLGMSSGSANSLNWRGSQGSSLKSTYGWYSNENGSNSSGFSGLPGGSRYQSGSFSSITKGSYFWSVTETSESEAMHRSLYYSMTGVHRNVSDKKKGRSVRCVKD